MSLVVIRCQLLSFVVTRCHSLSFVVTRCNLLSLVVTRSHSLSLVVSRCTTRCTTVAIHCHLLSFVVIWLTLVCLFINDRKNQGQGTNQSQFMTIGIQHKKLVIKKPTTQKKKFCVKDFFSKVKQIHKKMWILSHLLKNI